MGKEKKGFGSYFGRCFGIMFLVAILSFILPFIFKLVFSFVSKTTESSNSTDVLNFLNVFQIYLPIIAISASVPVSLIYAAIKTSK